MKIKADSVLWATVAVLALLMTAFGLLQGSVVVDGLVADRTELKRRLPPDPDTSLLEVETFADRSFLAHANIAGGTVFVQTVGSGVVTVCAVVGLAISLKRHRKDRAQQPSPCDSSKAADGLTGTYDS